MTDKRVQLEEALHRALRLKVLWQVEVNRADRLARELEEEDFILLYKNEKSNT